MEGKFKQEDVEISTDDIQEYLYNELIDLGYVPESEELEDIAEIMFDYFIEKFQILLEDDES